MILFGTLGSSVGMTTALAKIAKKIEGLVLIDADPYKVSPIALGVGQEPHQYLLDDLANSVGYTLASSGVQPLQYGRAMLVTGYNTNISHSIDSQFCSTVHSLFLKERVVVDIGRITAQTPWLSLVPSKAKLNLFCPNTASCIMRITQENLPTGTFLNLVGSGYTAGQVKTRVGLECRVGSVRSLIKAAINE